MEILMERTEKFMCSSEDYAEKLVERYKDNEDGYTVVDRKISHRTTKDSEYYIVTIKCMYKTLAEAKDEI